MTSEGPDEAAPEHRTRFDDEIAPGVAGLPASWLPDGSRRLRRGGGPRSSFTDAAGGRHEAYEQRVERPSPPGSRDPAKLDSQVWYRPPRGAPELAAHGPAFAPQIVVLAGGNVLIVFRLDGLKPPVRPPAGHSWSAEDGYLAAREGAGASVGYAYRSAQDLQGRWQRGWVARAEETLVRDRMEADAFRGRIYPAFETLGPPALGLDEHGVAWCLWANPLRRHTYFARWLGPQHGFSAPFEARGAYYGLHEQVAVEVRAPAGAGSLATAAITGGRVRVDGLSRLSVQGDLRFVDVLEQMGAEARRTDGFVEVVGHPLKGVEVNLADFSDAAPALAVTAAVASTPTRITGIGFIRHKESDRWQRGRGAAAVWHRGRGGTRRHGDPSRESKAGSGPDL